MKIEETYNIHKKINCVFPFFKNKLLCKKDIHIYLLHPQGINETNLKCRCCGKEINLED